MGAPKELLRLVKRFDDNLDAYKSGKYNEAQVRREFIDPFFGLLGWDIDNTQGHAEQYKDVIHEDSIKIGGATKAPDYRFRVGGTRKFFVEAKKPSAFIKEDEAAAFQVRRYAWSAKLPLSILTDFEEFAVYDCRIRPHKNDNPAAARLLYRTFDEYKGHWDEIASVFSKDAILKGSFDKYAEEKKGKRGTAEVDTAFLQEIESWRDTLARNLALRNSGLSQRELNYSVQAIIDRIIFLRICEDRGVEDYGKLHELLEGEGIYARLCGLFRQADDRYNSGLFHFKEEKGRSEPDRLTPDLALGDKPLRDMIRQMYYPDSPYEFSVLPADILGQVYEQFLGKVIRLTSGHRAVVEDKPEVKKAGGVYYTPTYIVKYIVENTVGRFLEGKTTKQAANLKILDPACGSGSFLIEAYQYLLDWHLGQCTKDNPKNRRKEITRDRDGELRLTTDVRKKILLANIYGVDIDPQAVEVTKLALLLKVLEGESRETLNSQLMLFHERALPDLGENIKCGNSLVGSDFLANQQLALSGGEDWLAINIFDWADEFSEIVNSGGFDAVIGNPPWGVRYDSDETMYFRRVFQKIIVRMTDSFMYFVHKSASLTKPGGYFSMILPDVVLYQRDNLKLRRFILDNFAIQSLINLGDVFQKVVRPSAIISTRKMSPRNGHTVSVADCSNLKIIIKEKAIFNGRSYLSIKQSRYKEIPDSVFVTKNPEYYNIWDKITKTAKHTLAEIVDSDGIQRGVSPDYKDAFILSKKEARQLSLEKELLRNVLTGGKQVKRYRISYDNQVLIYSTDKCNIGDFPNIRERIIKFKDKITCKEVKYKKHSMFSLHRARKESIFLKNIKIVGVITGDRIQVALDSKRYYVSDGLYVFGVKDDVDVRFIIGLLNSKLMVFLYRLLSFETGRVLAQVKPKIMETLPIPHFVPSNLAGREKEQEVSEYVSKIMKVHTDLESENVGHDRTVLSRKIDAFEKEIDGIIYGLYRLGKSEIRIVEESVK